MGGNKRGWVWVVVLTVGLARPAVAGPLFKGKGDGPDCPRPSYSCLHYLAPALYRWHAHHRTPQHLYATPRYPEIPLRFRADTYPCPAVDPAERAAVYGPGPRPDGR